MMMKIIISLFLLMSFSIRADEIKIAFANYPPYSYIENEKIIGIEIDLSHLIFRDELNIKTSHSILPWARVQQLVESGKIDAFIATRNMKRDAYALATETPLCYWQVSAFVRKNNSQFSSKKKYHLSDFKELNIGSLIGNGWLEKEMPDTKFTTLKSSQQMLKLLEMGRIDVIPEDSLVMNFYINKYGMKSQIKEINLDIKKVPMYLYISKKSPLIKSYISINNIIKRLKKEGKLKEKSP